jgi:FkbH-like protein
MLNKNEIQASASKNKPKRTIAITATFTAEPVEESLRFWESKLEIPVKIEFAPYNQVFQQLLDPSSTIAKNSHGMNVVLLRFEDWLHDKNRLHYGNEGKIQYNAKDLLKALRLASDRSSTPYIVCICPPSPFVTADANQMAICQEMESVLFEELTKINNLHFLRASEFINSYHVSKYYDSQSDELAYVPYTTDFFAVLGTMIFRKLYIIESAPYKVIVLDCDHTLWNGVCGEDGPLGIRIDEPHKKLQDFMVRQIDAGMVICLCSKNNEEDVIEVFDRRPEMPLRRDHIVSRRINWRPKSENIQSLANELQLGLDSFIFLDDNPVECAEVQANCPEVLTLQLPNEPENIPEFLDNVWAFDHLKITEEDKKRSRMYQENTRREQFRQKSLTFGNFLAGLELEIKSFEPTSHHVPRVAQLTQRTNQFNFSTIRRSEAELQKILESKALECLCIEVSDRFGDYGLVGIIFFRDESQAIKVDTFLLSCRVLGRGVEHRMLGILGLKAKKRGLNYVEVTYVPTAKNKLVLDFLESVGSKYKNAFSEGLGVSFKFPVESVVGIDYIQCVEKQMVESESAKEKADYSHNTGKVLAPVRHRYKLLNYIARNLTSAEQITKMMEAGHLNKRPALLNDYVAPGNELEKSICKIWQKILRIEKVGVNDNFFEVGGKSLLGIRVLSRVTQETGVPLRLKHLFDAPTVSLLGKLIETLKVSLCQQLNVEKLRGTEREEIAF